MPSPSEPPAILGLRIPKKGRRNTSGPCVVCESDSVSDRLYAIGHAQRSHCSTSGGRPSAQAPIAAISACFFFRALQTKNTKSTSMVSSSPPNTCRCTSIESQRMDGVAPTGQHGL